MADSLPMIARCLQHNLEKWPILHDYPPESAVLHSQNECEHIATMREHGPNLLLWTGRQHKLVLMLK